MSQLTFCRHAGVGGRVGRDKAPGVTDDSRGQVDSMKSNGLRARLGSRGSARGTLWTGAGIVASTFATLGANLYLVAVANPAAFADVAILTVLVLMFGTLARFGADRILVAEVHAAEAFEETLRGRGRGADLISFAMLTGTMGGLILLVPLSATVLNGALSRPLSVFEQSALAIWFASDVIRLVVGEAHRSQYRFKLAALSSYGVRAPLFLVLLVALNLINGPLSRHDLIIAASGASLMVCVATVALASREFHWWHSHPIRSGRRLWAGHVSMVLTTFAASLIGGADVWILGASVEPEATATYALAVTMVAGMAVLAAGITGGVLPYLASAMKRGEYRAIQSQIIGYVRGAAALAVTIYLGLLVLARPVAVSLGGETYSDITIYVAILGGGQVVNALAGIAGAVLIVARRYRLVMTVTVAVAVITTILEAIAGVWLHNPVLVALASGAATGILPIIGAISLSRTLQMRTDVLGRR